MPAKILDAQLKLTITDGGAKPDVFIKPQGHIITHLTQGFDAAAFPLNQGNALTAGAHVPLAGGMSDTTFSFIQVNRINFYGAFYAGRTSREGGVGVLAHNPPAMTNPVSLDAHDPSIAVPWFTDPSFTSFLAPSVNASWGDHPASKVPLKINNSITGNLDNFLFQFIDDNEYWTIFTAQDGDGTLRFIAHFHWQVRYDLEFMWRNGDAAVRKSKSFIKIIDRNLKGRPTEPDIQGLLSKPAGPRSNEVINNALKLAFKGGRGPNRSENPKWFTTVPADFWG